LNFCSVQTKFGIAPPNTVLPESACQCPTAVLPRSPLSLPHPAADTGPLTHPAPLLVAWRRVARAPPPSPVRRQRCRPSPMAEGHCRPRFFTSRYRPTHLGPSLSLPFPSFHAAPALDPPLPFSLPTPSRFGSRSCQAPLPTKALQTASSPPMSRFGRSRALRPRLRVGFWATTAAVRLLGRELRSLGALSY
jgi:hypothetical protein